MSTPKPVPRARAWRAPIAAKLATALIGLVVLVLTVNSAINTWLSYNQAKAAALEVQREKARSATDRVDEFLSEIETQLGWTTGAEWRYAPLEQRRYDFIRLLRQVPAITELSYLDGSGKEQLKVSRLEPDALNSAKDFSADPRFVRAVADKIWFGPVEFRRGSEPYMTIALSHVGRQPGVTVADVNLKLIWDVINAIHVGDKGYAFIVDGQGRLIAHPDLSLVLRGTDFSGLSQFRQAVADKEASKASVAEIATSFDGASVLTAYAASPRTHWIVFVQLPLTEALAAVYKSLWQTLALLGLGLALALIVGGLLARRLVAPIRQLQQGAERLGAGDLSERLDIRTGDEIETLADRFNQMAGSIKESYDTLEAKVETRTQDLNEALRLQTATADVLKVISRSAFDLQTVFDTLIASAVDLCEAHSGTICVRDGDVFRYRGNAGGGATDRLSEYLAAHPATPGRESMAGRVLLSGKVEAIPDRLADRDFAVPMDAHGNAARSLLGVPLLGKSGIEGALVLTRQAPGPFSNRHIEIVQTFADQAVIAIENVRLFEEVQARTKELSESLKQQTATSEVLKVISRSAFDLQVVLDTLVTSARELCESDQGIIWLREGDFFHAQATVGQDETAKSFFKANPRRITDKSLVPRVAASGQVEHIPDVLADPDYVPISGLFQINSPRAMLGVPLLHGDRVDGVFTMTRFRPDPFVPRQIELARTFADQAVIAIENSRLFEQVQARTRELAASLDDLRKAQDRLVQSEKLASLGQLTAGIAHEIKNPLNFVNNFAALSRELLDELRELLEKAGLQGDAGEDVADLIGMLSSNLEKVEAHGKRADSIVKNMLLHSREGASELGDVDVNDMVEDALNLAYHGARAEKLGFNVTIEKAFDPNAGIIPAHAQELTRVLLNLVSNAFYATNKRKLGETGAYEPTVTASTKDLGDRVEIAIRDNGSGIPEDVKAKIFNPFFTTKPAGEGTGLGLSLSHDIVVKQHGGALDVASEPGLFTEFTIQLPRADRRGQARTTQARAS
jgi:signal transduction histidine kinase